MAGRNSTGFYVAEAAWIVEECVEAVQQTVKELMPSCPLCKGEDFESHPALGHMPIPMVAIECTQCGHVELFSTRRCADLDLISG